MNVSSIKLTRPLRIRLAPLLWTTRLLLMIGIALPTAPVVAENYSGQWNLTTCISYSCDYIGIPVIQLSFCAVSVFDNYPSMAVTVPGAPQQLLGSFTTPTKFTVAFTDAGGCSTTYTLAGEFTAPTACTATFSVDFSGSNCAPTNCRNQSWLFTASRTIPPCCSGSTGNVDCDQANGTDISDLSALIDNLYISFSPLCCEAAANTDGQPGIDISDLSALIDFLYVSFTPTAPCQ